MMRLFLLRKRVFHPKNVIGFKWKPIVDNSKYDDAYRFAVEHNFKFLCLHRNPLDELISRRKHSMSKKDSGGWEHAVGAHCSLRADPNSDACLKQFQSLQIAANTSKIVTEILAEMNETLQVRKKMENLNAQFIEASCEDLVYGDEEKRFANVQRLADFYFLRVETVKLL